MNNIQIPLTGSYNNMSPEQVLEAYEKVNQCKTFEQLADAIRSLKSVAGEIQGRNRSFSAEQMASRCTKELFLLQPRYLTRNFGIRQQAYYIAAGEGLFVSKVLTIKVEN